MHRSIRDLLTGCHLFGYIIWRCNLDPRRQPRMYAISDSRAMSTLNVVNTQEALRVVNFSCSAAPRPGKLYAVAHSPVPCLRASNRALVRLRLVCDMHKKETNKRTKQKNTTKCRHSNVRQLQSNSYHAPCMSYCLWAKVQQILERTVRSSKTFFYLYVVRFVPKIFALKLRYRRETTEK